jgi:hypothetical protein
VQILVVSGAALLVAAFAATAAPAQPRPLLVGFEDEPSFLWSNDRFAMLDRAAAAHTSLIRVIANWRDIAPTRPRDPANPADPAYHFEGFDDLVWQSELRGIRVLFTIWGTPVWASASRRLNAAPRPADLGPFCTALAARYSGHFRGHPFVSLFSVWNEPNKEQFLSPQFDARGGDRSPQLYAAMFSACAAGIRSASPKALIAIGETAPRGTDAPRGTVQASHSPGRFAELLARVRPRVRFDAWAHHPYPTGFRGPPAASFAWPNVGVGNLEAFDRRLGRMFGRPVPLWLTEFAYQTAPERPGALTYGEQASYLARAFSASVAAPAVRMFVWYIFRDTPGQLWQSGLLQRSGSPKPSYNVFRRAAAGYDVANPTVVIPPKADPRVTLSLVDFKADQVPGDPPIGMTYRVFDRRGTVVAAAQPRATLDPWGRIVVVLDFRPEPGRTYVALFDLNDIHGHTGVHRARLLVSKG